MPLYTGLNDEAEQEWEGLQDPSPDESAGGENLLQGF